MRVTRVAAEGAAGIGCASFDVPVAAGRRTRGAAMNEKRFAENEEQDEEQDEEQEQGQPVPELEEFDEDELDDIFDKLQGGKK